MGGAVTSSYSSGRSATAADITDSAVRRDRAARIPDPRDARQFLPAALMFP